jgi:hypothetical protein
MEESDRYRRRGGWWMVTIKGWLSVILEGFRDLAGFCKLRRCFFGKFLEIVLAKLAELVLGKRGRVNTF